MDRLKTVPSPDRRERREKSTLQAFFRGRTRSSWLRERDRRDRLCRHWGFLPEIRHIPPEALDPHPLHPRRFPTLEEVEQLAHSLRFHGLGQPLLVMVQPDNPERYWVLNGMRRLQAIRLFKSLSWKTVPCQVSQGMSRYQALALMVAMDHTVESYNVIEQGIAFRQLRQELDLTQEELAQYIRVGQAYISLCENFVQGLHPEIVETYMGDTARRIVLSHLRELLRLRAVPEIQLEVFRRLQEGGWSVRRLRQEVDARLAGNVALLPDRNLCFETRYFNLVLKPRTNRPIPREDLMSQLFLVNQAFFELWGLTMEDMADWYDRVADKLRQDYRRIRRQAG